MKLKLKILILFIFGLLFLFVIANFLFYFNNKTKSDVIEKRGDVEFLFVKSDSRMSFGSGHKTLYVYKKGFLIGKAVYGEFPIQIKDINKNKCEIILELFEQNGNEDYIKLYTEKNKKIAGYKIKYLFTKKTTPPYMK